MAVASCHGYAVTSSAFECREKLHKKCKEAKTCCIFSISTKPKRK
jgi:hypothetical protein